ncbi:MAG: UDP-3-O-acyl-N-acetylglucosamine deacetylase [Deltaproteobacteria bacterium]|jgi:UDP-3-O-[3-hydroxymyristoyl] N-acetylglucosamine deacetylase|nr:UDP-3-O-acyl-N-acetylglucosamine deacetylase [Deltaproteobacteria bacterium]
MRKMHRHQKTVSQEVRISGIGLHTGKKVDAVLSPLPVGSGIWFRRTDSPGAQPVLAAVENVTDTSLATTIGRGQESVGTLEHLLAALGGLGISNLKVEVNGPEVPILDGSALPWLRFLQKAGIATLQAPRTFYRVKRPFAVSDGDGRRSITVEPSQAFSIDCEIEFPGYVDLQRRVFRFSQSAFVSEIAPARTFCLERDVAAMQASGKALGGGLDNAVVIGGNGRVLNTEGLRFRDECVRHKILDFLGDLTLAQLPVAGRFTAVRTGHTMNRQFLQALLKTPGILEKVTSESPGHVENFELPPLPAAAVAL